MLEPEEIVAALRALPTLTPDPTWKERTKIKLLYSFDRRGNAMQAQRQWALYVSTDNNPAPVADWIRARGSDWRPVAVSPERMTPALHAINPVLVVIDSKLRDRQALAVMARNQSAARVISDRELAA